jgi:hypothetical protein
MVKQDGCAFQDNTQEIMEVKDTKQHQGVQAVCMVAKQTFHNNRNIYA